MASGEGVRRCSSVRGGPRERVLRNEMSSEPFSGIEFAQLESSPKCDPQRRLSDSTSLSAGKDHLMNPNRLSRAHAAGENPAHPVLKQSAPRSLPNQYAELKRLIKQRGLLDQQPVYFAGKSLLTLGLLAVGLTLLLILDNLWLQLLNAAYLAFVFVQLSLLAHDFGHRQFSFRTPWKNDWLTLVFGNLSLGVSRQWWIDKHNEHHGHPNQMDLDPDVDIPLLAFEEEQALEKRGFARFVVKYQAALIFPLSLLQAISMLRSSIEFLAAKKAKSTLVEALTI